MTRPGLRDPLGKAVLRSTCRAGLGVHERFSAPTSGGGGAPRLYSGGARAGDRGGPKVKIAKLASAFPEHWWSYNLVYVLSNAPYLPPTALHRLKGRAIPIVGNQNGVFYAGSVLPLSLSCDHRVVDGAEGARFLSTVTRLLEEPTALLPQL